MRWPARPHVLCPPCGVAQRLQDVLALEVGEVSQDLVDGVAGTDLSDDHAHGDSHPADAGLAAHHLGLLGDAIERTHGRLLAFSELIGQRGGR